MNNLSLYREHLGFWPMRKTDTLLEPMFFQKNISHFFVYDTKQTKAGPLSLGTPVLVLKLVPGTRYKWNNSQSQYDCTNTH